MGGGGWSIVLEDCFGLIWRSLEMLSVGEEGKGHPWNK